jgi:hypothetical protein
VFLSEQKLRNIISQIIKENLNPPSTAGASSTDTDIFNVSGNAPNEPNATYSGEPLMRMLKKGFSILKQICEKAEKDHKTLHWKALMYPTLKRLTGIEYSSNQIQEIWNENYKRGIFIYSIADFINKIIEEAENMVGIDIENNNKKENNKELHAAFTEIENKFDNKLENFFIEEIFMKKYEDEELGENFGYDNEIDFDKAKKLARFLAEKEIKKQGFEKF